MFIGLIATITLNFLAKESENKLKEKITLLELKQRPRKLNTEQENRLISWLKQTSRIFIDIAFPIDNSECRFFAENFLHVFRKAGQRPDFQKLTFGFENPKGISIRIKNKEDTSLKTAKSLYWLFDNIGLYPTLIYDKQVSKGKILIVIGLKINHE